jgi:hypothetical protein
LASATKRHFDNLNATLGTELFLLLRDLGTTSKGVKPVSILDSVLGSFELAMDTSSHTLSNPTHQRINLV